MPKKPNIGTLIHSKHVKVSKTLHKPAPLYFCHIFRSLCTEIWSENFVSVVSEIFRLFVNILAPNDKYSVSVKARVWRNQFKCYYLRIKKNFLNFFLHFRNLHKTSNTLKKRCPLEFICFSSYRLQKAILLKCRKSLLSEHLWTIKMLKRPKHCINLHCSIFARFFDHSETKSATKILFE